MDNAAGAAAGRGTSRELPVPLEFCDPSGGGGGANEFDPPGNDKVTGPGVGGNIAR